MGKRVSVIAIVILSVVVIVPAGARAASFADDAFHRINSERTSRGVSALRWNADVASVAKRHSDEMADRQSLSHNSDLGNELDGWSEIGENVGSGQSISQIHDMFMASATHRENILDRAFTDAGVGVTSDTDGTLWVTVDFYTPQQHAARASSSSPRRATRSRTSPPAPRVSRSPSAAASRTATPRPDPPTPATAPDPSSPWVEPVEPVVPFGDEPEALTPTPKPTGTNEGDPTATPAVYRPYGYAFPFSG